MRVAYLSRGNSVYDRRFLEKMVERGYKVCFISYHPSEKVEVEGVENYHYDYTSMHRPPVLRFLRTVRHLRRLLRHIKPDILHTGWVQDMGLFGALSGFHPTLSMPWGSDVLLRPHDSRLAMWKTRFTLKKADKITCDAEAVKSKIIKISSCDHDKIIVFPWGIDLNTFYPSNARPCIREKLGWQDKKILIMTRNMEISLYGHEIFISSLPDIIKNIPDTRVILVHDGLLKEKIQRRVAKLNLEKYVYYAGWLDERAMAEHLNAADIYISAAISDGTSCSLLEAMACGLPVVVTDFPTNKEWVVNGQNGYLVPCNDVNMLSEAIVKLIKEEQSWSDIGIRNRKIIEARADWEKNFNKLETIYNELVIS